MKIPFEWEIINEGEGSCLWTERAKVIGGWIIKIEVIDIGENKTLCMALNFIADPNHEWGIEE